VETPRDGRDLHDYEEAVGAALREVMRRAAAARTADGISQRELAERMGTTQAALSNWEVGRRRPGLTELVALADALGRDLAWLLEPLLILGSDAEPQGGSPSLRQRLAELRHLIDEVEREEVRRLAQQEQRPSEDVGP
jgi:transcriptional regulator with XRE-family HTH domain